MSILYMGLSKNGSASIYNHIDVGNMLINHIGCGATACSDNASHKIQHVSVKFTRPGKHRKSELEHPHFS